MSDQRQVRGIVLMTIAMLTVPVVDGIAKYLSSDFSPYFISWARYAIACSIVLPVAFFRVGPRLFPRTDLAAHFVRTAFLVTAMTLYFVSISEIPLALATSAYFVGPIFAVVLSLIFLGEPMTKRKGLSLALGFIGSMIILEPGTEIEPGVVLAFGSGVCFAIYLVATKKASGNSDPFRTLSFQCVMGALLLAPQAALTFDVPGPETFIFFLGLGLFSAFAHLLTIVAFKYADAITLSPLVYFELLGSVVIGFVIFSEIPSVATAIGAVFIVLGGYVLIARRAET